MLRKRGLCAAVAFTLALGLGAAPAAVAAGPSDPGPGGFWASLHSWAHELLVDWLGWGEPEQGPDATYEASDCPEDDSFCQGPTPTGGTGEDGSTTDEGAGFDPDG